MKIGIGWPVVQEVHLPPEIIAVIVKHISGQSVNLSQQRTLWSCCLVSKAWYSGAIASLYYAPRLNNRNFDKLSRTICPPINSHVRRIGLESFIVRLDMGSLAYESSKSLTARLLRRAHTSLEVFIAPAVSFSVACLAPLSKCRNLKILDLSRDFYDIDLSQLLHAIRNLDNLESLSLPKSAFRKQYSLHSRFRSTDVWPANLKYLQINNSMPTVSEEWEDLLKSIPVTLNTIVCQDSIDYNSIWLLHDVHTKNLQVQTLIVGSPRREDTFPVAAVLTIFPNLKRLSLPLSVLPPVPFDSDETHDLGKHLEYLELRNSSSPVSVSHLYQYLQLLPSLRRIDLHESALDIDDDTRSEILDNIQNIMARRGDNGNPSQAGIFLMEND